MCDMLPCLMFVGNIVTYYILQDSCQNPSNQKIFLLFFGIFSETLYLCTRKQRNLACFVLQKTKGWFGSSVGLEQQPSKLRVKGSSPFRITKSIRESPKRNSLFCVIVNAHLSSAHLSSLTLSPWDRLIFVHIFQCQFCSPAHSLQPFPSTF